MVARAPLPVRAGAARVLQEAHRDRLPDASLSSRPPPELTELLTDHPAARATFEALPPSHRRQYSVWIASAKRPETRQRRAAKAIDMLARGERLGMV